MWQISSRKIPLSPLSPFLGGSVAMCVVVVYWRGGYRPEHGGPD